MRWVNAQLGRLLGWVERAIQQEVVTLFFILHVHEAISCGIISHVFLRVGGAVDRKNEYKFRSDFFCLFFFILKGWEERFL